MPGDEATRQAAAAILSERDNSLATQYNQYSPMQGAIELRQAIADFNRTIYGAEYNSDNEVLIATSGTEALYNIVMALVNPGEHVVVFEPFFPWYLPHLKMADAEVSVGVVPNELQQLTQCACGTHLHIEWQSSSDTDVTVKSVAET
eukprot:TRINITY_DN4789_c0_g1_i1.p2 TRINITY_DN4789_c0_g1~~TRINITY_DN4789_c0_g1_i1.p2  ORF type:complete len:147 (+),score=27.39 TRINITY_DN4789_c0_g1_i1:135-575(+)